MTWYKLGRFKVGPQSAHELHVKNVYEDSDFVEDVALLPKGRQPYKEIAKIRNGTSTPSSEADFRIKELADKYAISIDEVDWYLSSNYPQHGFIRRGKKPFSISDIGDGYISVRFNDDTTKEDYLQAWEQIVKVHSHRDSSASKNKLPVYDKLLYAIFKARRDGKSFVWIFHKYSMGELPGYIEGARGIISEDKLKSYYKKFDPDSGSDN